MAERSLKDQSVSVMHAAKTEEAVTSDRPPQRQPPTTKFTRHLFQSLDQIMSFLGFRKWPTPVRLSVFSALVVALTLALCTRRSLSLSGRSSPRLPSPSTLSRKCRILVSDVRVAPHCDSEAFLIVFFCWRVAEEYAKDPRNPYAAQISKEAHH